MKKVYKKNVKKMRILHRRVRRHRLIYFKDTPECGSPKLYHIGDEPVPFNAR